MASLSSSLGRDVCGNEQGIVFQRRFLEIYKIENWLRGSYCHPSNGVKIGLCRKANLHPQLQIFFQNEATHRCLFYFANSGFPKANLNRSPFEIRRFVREVKNGRSGGLKIIIRSPDSLKLEDDGLRLTCSIKSHGILFWIDASIARRKSWKTDNRRRLVNRDARILKGSASRNRNRCCIALRGD